MNVYFDGLGWRNPVTEHEQIAWFLEQSMSGKTKSIATRFWLDAKEKYSKQLIKAEAFELLNYIQSKATVQQEIRRALSRIKTKAKAEKEMAAIKNHMEQCGAKRELIKNISLN